jgi:hypothetical protein
MGSRVEGDTAMTFTGGGRQNLGDSQTGQHHGVGSEAPRGWERVGSEGGRC